MFQVDKILVPTDFSETSFRTVKQTFDWAEKLGSKIEILHVVDIQSVYAVYADTMSYYPDLEPKIMQAAEKDMQTFVNKLSPPVSLKISTAIKTGSTAEFICDYAKKNGFGLILIGTHGRRGFQHLVLGSVAEKVVQLSSVPVLTLRLEK